MPMTRSWLLLGSREFWYLFCSFVVVVAVLLVFLTTDDGLKPNTPLERVLSTGEVHVHNLDLKAGQFLDLTVDQHGVDVGIKLLSPDGEVHFEGNTPNGPAGLESLFFLTPKTANYRLEVESLNRSGKPASYRILMKVKDQVEPQDRHRLAAQRLFLEATILQFSQPAIASKRNAVEIYQRTIDLWQQAGDKYNEAQTLSVIGAIYANLNEVDEAIEYSKKSLTIWESLQEPAIEDQPLTFPRETGRVFINMGAVLGNQRSVKEKKEAEVHLKRGVDLVRGRSAYLEAAALNNLSGIYRDLGERQEERAALERALTMNDHPVLHINLASNLKLGNFFDEAIHHMDRASKLLADNLQLKAIVLDRLGSLYYDLGDYDSARSFYNNSLELAERRTDEKHRAELLNKIGLVDYREDRMDVAEERILRALELTKGTPAAATSYHNLALLSKDDHEKALQNYSRALDLDPAPVPRATSLFNVGLVNDILGRDAEAERFYRDCLELSRSIGYSVGESRALFGLARLARQRGDLLKARQYVEESLSIIRASSIDAPSLRAFYRASTNDIYELLIDVYVRLHRFDPKANFHIKALQQNEAARSQNLLGQLTKARIEGFANVPPDLAAKEYELRERISAKSEILLRFRIQDREEDSRIIGEELADLIRELDLVSGDIRKIDPAYASLTDPDPPYIESFQADFLEQDSLLLEYHLGSEHSYVWAVTNASVTVYDLPSRKDIEELGRLAYSLLGARNRKVLFETGEEKEIRVTTADREYLEVSARLSELVLEPVESELRNASRIIVVADGILRYLPFSALPIPAGGSGSRVADWLPLIKKHEIVTLPSISVLNAIRQIRTGREPQQKTLAVFADPVFHKEDSRVEKRSPREEEPPDSLTDDYSIFEKRAIARSLSKSSSAVFDRLTFTRDEAEQILDLVPESQRFAAFDFSANQQTVTESRLHEYRIVHFATHGILDSQQPELSGLVLSLVDDSGEQRDGFLQLSEIYSLSLPAELVVLSACETALGREIRGEGLVGVTWGFLHAGTLSVVATLWQVNDPATAELMRRFYRAMFADGLKPAAALQKAQASFLDESEWQSPYYWAPFLFVGDWQ